MHFSYYSTLSIIIILLAGYIDYVLSECVDGECKLVSECETIPFLKEKSKTREQGNYLRKIGCGFQGIVPMICCPKPVEIVKECEASNSAKGICKAVVDCPALYQLPLIQALDFLTPCTGDGKISVCCPTFTPTLATSSSTQPTIPTSPVVQCPSNPPTPTFTPLPYFTPATSTPTPTSTAISTSTSTSASTTRAFTTCEATPLPPDANSGCCGIDATTESSRILEGSDTKIDQYPWLVLLEYETDFGGKGTKCGGALISSRYVLTAAHCVHKNITKTTVKSVRLGEHDIRQDVDCADDDVTKCNNGSFSIPVVAAIIHDLYAPTVTSPHDIALLHLLRPAVFSDFIRPICLPSADEVALDAPSVAGWGAVGSNYVNPVKMHATIPFVNSTACKARFPKFPLRETHICAGGEKLPNACSGDSGGPLMHHRAGHHEIIGIVSFGMRNCRAGHPSVYTKVSSYIDWIWTHVRDD